MKLLLTSSGVTNKSIANALLKLLGKPFERANMTFVPTASNPIDEDKHWLVNDMNNFMRLGFKNFYVNDIASAPKKVWLKNFEDSDVIGFGGGNTVYLLEQMETSDVKKILPGLMKTKIYVGISAGSMATAKQVSLASDGILYYEDTGGFQSKEGLGFIDFEIRPHLNSNSFPKVKIDFLEKLNKDFPHAFYAIDDNTAIQVNNGKITVISEGVWKKFN